jgi:dihydrofolate reductase
LTKDLPPGRSRTRLLTGTFVEGVKQLKAAAGKNIIVVGGIALAFSLIAERLMEETQFYMNPVVLGDGRSTFTQAGRLALR